MNHDEAVEYVRNNLTVEQVWPEARVNLLWEMLSAATVYVTREEANLDT